MMKRLLDFIVRKPFASLLWLALLMHGTMFLYDYLKEYAPFLQGDRSYVRFEMMEKVLADPSLATIATVGVVPGEYLFQLPAYLLGGVPGVILFQIALTVLSVVCIAKLAQSYFQWPFAAFTCGAAYLLVPQNLVFAHQFVTEAIATPCSVFALYFLYRYAKTRTIDYAVWAALVLGVAIFVRPSLAVIVPLFTLSCIWYRMRKLLLPWRGIACIACASLAPLLVWMAIFTYVTGQVGYTTGVANLGWNLRSKVFLISTTNGIEKPPEIKSFAAYEDLYHDPSGISVGRFAALAAANPAAYLKAFVVDAAIVFSKANTTKLTVDYLNMARDKNIKDWRNVLDVSGVGGLVTWAGGQLEMLAVFVIESIGSLLMVLIAGITLVMTIYWLLNPRAPLWDKPERLVFLLFMASMMATVLISGEIVDRAQARIRHPIDGMLILMVGFILSCYHSCVQARKNLL